MAKSHVYIVGGRRKRETDKSNGKAGMSTTEGPETYTSMTLTRTWSEPVITNANIQHPVILERPFRTIIHFWFSCPVITLADDNAESDIYNLIC